MSTKLSALIISVLCCVQASAGLNEWTYSKKVDAMTDEVNRSISVENDSEHKLTTYADSKGRFWLTVSLGGFDQFSHERAPMLRVDKYPPMDFNDEIVLQELIARLDPEGAEIHYEWNPGFVNVMLGGDVTAVTTPDANEKAPMTEFMRGEKIALRYWLGTGGYKDTEFTLSGFAKNAPKVFNLGDQ
jgi:hypothetical protein